MSDIERRVAGVERKVEHLDSDVQHIYERLVTIHITQERQGNRMDDIVQEINRVDAKLAKRLDAQDKVLERHGETLDTHGDLLRTILSRLPK